MADPNTPEITTGTGPTLAYAEWMLEDITLVPLEPVFRTHYGPGADQFMDRATLDRRIEALPEGGGDPMSMAARADEDAALAKARHDEDAKRLATRKAEDLVYSRKHQDEKIIAKRKAEDDALALKAEAKAAASGNPVDSSYQATLAETRKAEDESLLAQRKAEDDKIAEAAKAAEETHHAPRHRRHTAPQPAV